MLPILLLVLAVAVVLPVAEVVGATLIRTTPKPQSGATAKTSRPKILKE